MGPDIKIASLNVAGLLNIVKCNRIARYLWQQQVGFICLQETHLKSEQTKLLPYFWNGEFYHTSSERRSAGVMIGIRWRVPWVLSQNILDPAGRYVILEGLLCSHEVSLVGMYAPNQNQSKFGEELHLQVLPLCSDEVIILGDFNGVIDKDLDRFSESSSCSTLPKSFFRFMVGIDWCM